MNGFITDYLIKTGFNNLKLLKFLIMKTTTQVNINMKLKNKIIYSKSFLR